MVTPELLDFIRQHQQAGTPTDQINSQLLSQGWPQSDIDQAWGQLSGAAVPAPTIQGSPKKSKLVIVVIVAVVVIVAIVGIGLLSSVALVSQTQVQKSARDAQRKSDLVAYRAGLEAYHTQKNEYPASLSKIDTTAPNIPGSIFTSTGPLAAGNFVTSTPVDPQNVTNNCLSRPNGDLQTCSYKYLGTKTGYVIWALMENPVSSGGCSGNGGGVYRIDSTGASCLDSSEPTTTPTP